MRRYLAGLYLSNVLLLGFSVAWLVLIFIPLLIASDHAMGLWYENNLVILTLEAAGCAVAIGWSMSRVVVYMKRQARICRKRPVDKEHYVKQ